MSKITISELHQAIKQAQTIILTVHVHPDGDALGSMLSMYETLLQQGKDVVMVVDDSIPIKYKFLDHVDAIYHVNDYVQSHRADMLLVLDASTYERIGRVGELSYATIYNIDHHVSNTNFADGLYLQTNFAATGEILTYLYKEWNWKITPSMANALYMAIATDCGFFKFSNTTGHTLAMAAYCVDCGAMPHIVSEALESTTIERIEITKLAMQTISFYKNGTVATIELHQEAMKTLGNDTDGFVDLIRNINSVDIAILLKAQDDTTTRVSLRSKQTDVNAIANHFGGGGHIRAAGCTISASLEEAKRKLLQVID